MAYTIRLGIMMGLMVTLLLIGTIYVFKPSAMSQSDAVKPRVVNAQTHTSLEKKKELIKQDQRHHHIK